MNSLINQKWYIGVHSKNCRLADKKLNISERDSKKSNADGYSFAICLYTMHIWNN